MSALDTLATTWERVSRGNHVTWHAPGPVARSVAVSPGGVALRLDERDYLELTCLRDVEAVETRAVQVDDDTAAVIRAAWAVWWLTLGPAAVPVREPSHVERATRTLRNQQAADAVATRADYALRGFDRESRRDRALLIATQVLKVVAPDLARDAEHLPADLPPAAQVVGDTLALLERHLDARWEGDDAG